MKDYGVPTQEDSWIGRLEWKHEPELPMVLKCRHAFPRHTLPREPKNANPKNR